MRFYWDGYAEVLHLATAMRILPPRPPSRHPMSLSRPADPYGLRRLWHRLRRLISLRPLP
jgi:hypothetical protein